MLSEQYVFYNMHNNAGHEDVHLVQMYEIVKKCFYLQYVF